MPNQDDACLSCGEGLERGECPKGQRPCGHHCNHSWTHDMCDWCGKTFGCEERAARPTNTERGR